MTSTNANPNAFTLAVAGTTVRIEALHGTCKKLAADYLAPDDSPIAATFTTTPDDIARERTSDAFSDGYLETLVVLRKLAEWGPEQGFFLMHGVVVEFEGRAYIFTAPSGTGKSTHARLWQEHVGPRVHVINGDKPFLRLDERDGAATITAYGTPWCGKEYWHENTSAPLAGIVIISQGTDNQCERLDPAAVSTTILKQIHLPESPVAAALTLGFTDTLLATVPVFGLSCDMSRAAVAASFAALTGRDLDGEA